eukprot:995900-Prorocentrum_minimum.AAC.4
MLPIVADCLRSQTTRVRFMSNSCRLARAPPLARPRRCPRRLPHGTGRCTPRAGRRPPSLGPGGTHPYSIPAPATETAGR